MSQGERTSDTDVTSLLKAWKQGDAAAADGVLTLVYGQLRKIARSKLREAKGSVSVTIRPTELANELVASLLDGKTSFESREHLLRMASVAMRNFLCDLGRRKSAVKRGGGLHAVSLSAAECQSADTSTKVEELYEALAQLRVVDERAAYAMELNHLIGLQVDEVAAMLGVSTPTINRDLKFGRAWLRTRLEE